MQQEPIQTYIFTGFLESGKTSFINSLLTDGGFISNQPVLFIQCEGGEEEPCDFAEIIKVENEDGLNEKFFAGICKTNKYSIIMIEYNGLWSIGSLLASLPEEMESRLVICTVDARSYDLYSKNMGNYMFSNLRSADLIVFNRCTDERKKELYKKNIWAINPWAKIYLDSMDGTSEDYAFNVPLPYKIDDGITDIAPEDFGVFYIDCCRTPEKYENRVFRIFGELRINGESQLTLGRDAMVCCPEDITFLAFPVETEKQDELAGLRWLYAIVTVKEANNQKTGKPQIVLDMISCESGAAPENLWVYF